MGDGSYFFTARDRVCAVTDHLDRRCSARRLVVRRVVLPAIRRIPGILMHPLTPSSVELALRSGRLASTTEAVRMLRDRADRPDRSQTL